MSTDAGLERLKDKGDRLDLAYEFDYNVPGFTPLRVGREFQPPSAIDSKALRELESMTSRYTQFTIRTYKPYQTIGSEPLLLNVSHQEGLILTKFALGIYSISKTESLPIEVKEVLETLRARADETLHSEGYSFGREYYKLLSRNRDGTRLNVLFQEYINRDHAERSGRIAFYRDGRIVYSYKSAAESDIGPIVRDVDYSSRGVVSGMFSRLGEISDNIIRSKVAYPLRRLVELFPWKQGVVVEFDYHAVPVGRRPERLIIYDFHEAEITVEDVTGRALSDPASKPDAGVRRPGGATDPKEVAEHILGATPKKDAIYVSGEITTGLKFYKLLRESGIDDVTEVSAEKEPRLRLELRALLENNLIRLKSFGERLKMENPSRPVIIPGETYIPDWNQDDYMILWDRVIRWGVKVIYFLDGWEYSNGAAAEYCLGQELHLELLDEHAKVLSVEEALRRLRTAIENLRRMGFEAPKLVAALNKLRLSSPV